jgi:hypothetical protein
VSIRTSEIGEVEVDCRYAIRDAIGLDTGLYGFPHVARWSDGFVELVKDSRACHRLREADPVRPSMLRAESRGWSDAGPEVDVGIAQ